MTRHATHRLLKEATLAALITGTFTVAPAQAADRQLMKLASGQQITVFGEAYRAEVPTIAVASRSSELITIAVIDGRVSAEGVTASAGQTLVTPIDRAKNAKSVRQFGFDAARLAATLPPEWVGDAAAPLKQMAAQQKRKRFWGLIETAGLNASAPSAPGTEAVRQSYLGNETITSLRRSAQGNPQTLAGLTVKCFAEAVAAGDAQTVADLIDPKPFTDTGASAETWQTARLAFAQGLIADPALKAAMAMPPGAPGAYTIQLVARDRAMFVSAVEPKS